MISQRKHHIFSFLLLLTMVVNIPFAVADTIAEDAEKVNEAAKAAEFFARMAGKYRTEGNCKLCFEFALASGAAAEAAKRLAKQVIDRIKALPEDQRRQHFESKLNAEVDRDAAVKAAEKVEGCVTTVFVIVFLIILFVIFLFLWLRWRAFGPFFGSG